MPQPLTGGLPPGLLLGAGTVIRLNALDPTTGAAVSGVRVTDAAYQVRPINIGADALGADGAPLPLLVPSSELV